jgi:hypothetical protein
MSNLMDLQQQHLFPILPFPFILFHSIQPYYFQLHPLQPPSLGFPCSLSLLAPTLSSSFSLLRALLFAFVTI